MLKVCHNDYGGASAAFASSLGSFRRGVLGGPWASIEPPPALATAARHHRHIGAIAGPYAVGGCYGAPQSAVRNTEGRLLLLLGRTNQELVNRYMAGSGNDESDHIRDVLVLQPLDPREPLLDALEDLGPIVA
jgi:hypothetical protein